MKSESRIQQEIVVWYNNNYCLPKHEPREFILHIPNEGKGNGKLVAVGLYPGASDLIFSFRGVIYFCEVKDEKGTQKPNQKKFHKHIEQCGFEYFVVRSLEEFKQRIGFKSIRNIRPPIIITGGPPPKNIS